VPLIDVARTGKLSGRHGRCGEGALLRSVTIGSLTP
jgi:hypothetical protein